MVDTYILAIGLMDGYNKGLFSLPGDYESASDVLGDFEDKMGIDGRDAEWILTRIRLIEMHPLPQAVFDKRLKEAKKSEDWQLIEKYALKNKQLYGS